MKIMKIPSNKIQISYKYQHAAQALAPRVGICNFDIVCNLRIVIWDFSAVSGKANHFYLNQLELTLTNP